MGKYKKKVLTPLNQWLKLHPDYYQMEKSLRYQENQNQVLFELNPNIVIFIDRNGSITRCNPVTEDVTGLSKELLRTKTLFDIIDEEHIEKAAQAIMYVLEGAVETVEIAFINQKRESTINYLTFIPSMIDNKVEEIVCIGRDITKKRKAQEQAEKIANEDVLTSLPNRRLFIHTLEASLHELEREKRKAAVLFLDIDRFKIINDTLGHLLGDRALIEIANRLRDCIRNGDLLARMGGDEFMVLLPHITSYTEITHVSQRIIERMNEPLDIDGYEFTLTASIGISVFPDSGKDAVSLIKCADTAMYRAKAQGANNFVIFNSEMNKEFQEWFRVENDLRKALERDEFELYFQPQYNTKSRVISGVEVLVRWKHPVLGIISPGKFITIAEETGLIVEIGEWVLDQACKQMKSWLDKGFPKIPISVNLSLRQFMQKNIVQSIERILKETGLPPEFLDLEITESVTIDLLRTMNILKRLKELGVKISLDDFGTGYSSLQYLSKFPIDELKIDQVFVKSIGTNNNDNAIITMIINLGHLLNLEVIAEGVESKEQLDYLTLQGCDKVQGYYYCKPLTAKQFEETVKQTR